MTSTAYRNDLKRIAQALQAASEHLNYLDYGRDGNEDNNDMEVQITEALTLCKDMGLFLQKPTE
jgi:hypothetical protein